MQFVKPVAAPKVAPEPDASKLTTIFVKTLELKQLELSVPLASYSVDELKRHIAEATETPTDEVRLVFAGKILESERLLIDYNLQTESTVHMVSRLRGGHGLEWLHSITASQPLFVKSKASLREGTSIAVPAPATISIRVADYLAGITPVGEGSFFHVHPGADFKQQIQCEQQLDTASSTVTLRAPAYGWPPAFTVVVTDRILPGANAAGLEFAAIEQTQPTQPTQPKSVVRKGCVCQ